MASDELVDLPLVILEDATEDRNPNLDESAQYCRVFAEEHYKEENNESVHAPGSDRNLSSIPDFPGYALMFFSDQTRK